MAVDVKASDSKALAVFEEMKGVLAPFPSSEYHLLLPTTFVGVSPLFVPMPAVVQVNPNDPREVYDTPGARDGSVCLHSAKLEQIANAGGLDFDPTLELHTHDFAKEPYLCQMSVGGWYIDSIGQRRLVGDGVTHDLRDGSKRVKLLGGPAAKPVDVARQFICEQARSRARARVVRKCMNLASSFKKEELRKPFVAVRFRMNEADEDVKRALIARGVGASAEVFGERRALPAPPASDAGEDIIEGQATQSEDIEPEIPDAPEPIDVQAIAAAFKQRARARNDQQRASDELLGHLAFALATVFQLPNRKGSTEDKAAISLARKGIASVLYGKSVKDLSAAEANVVIDAVKDPASQRDLCALAELIGVPQTLASASRSL